MNTEPDITDFDLTEFDMTSDLLSGTDNDPIAEPTTTDLSFGTFNDQTSISNVQPVPAYDTVNVYNQPESNYVQPIVVQPMLDQPMLDQPILDQPILDQPTFVQPICRSTNVDITSRKSISVMS